MIVLFIIINAVISAAAQVVLKIGVNRIGSVSVDRSLDFFVQAATSPYVLTGTGLYVLSLALWLVILTKASVSFAYPIMSLAYVFGLVFAMLFLGERVVPWQWAGVGCIILGTYLIAHSA
ncbi:MAG: EamA family transporter [Candidatus Kerfeldbacteria bacterium]|nr:EamA family transporter [Candidatus Kerfeldbacteria bacterium]